MDCNLKVILFFNVFDSFYRLVFINVFIVKFLCLFFCFGILREGENVKFMEICVKEVIDVEFDYSFCKEICEF